MEKQGFKEEEVESKLDEFLAVLEKDYLVNLEESEISVFDGIYDLLTELENRGVLLGLVTGNTRTIAECKLSKVGLYKYFKVGGYGDEAIERVDLVKIALRRANKNFDFIGNAFVVGDTPLDVTAGKEAGVKTIGVTTGIYGESDLEKAGADFVLDNLEDTEKFLKIIGC